MNQRTSPLSTTLLLLSLAGWANTAATAPLVEAQTVGREPAPPMMEALTLTEAAALLRVDAARVERLAVGQKIPARQVEGEWRFSKAALLAWLAGDWTFRTLVDPASVLAEAEGVRTWSGSPGQALTAQGASAVVGRGTTNARSDNNASTEPNNSAIGIAPGQRTANEVFLREQQVLLEPNELSLDVGVFHTRRDRQLLAEAPSGGTVLANAESQTTLTQITARYSLVRDTEIFATTSHVRQSASVFAGDERISRAARAEMGDVGIGLRHTLLREDVGRPDVIVSLDARIPTGDTSPAIGTAVTLVKSLDPAVLFGTLGYRRTFSREFADTTRLEPRHRVDVTLGFAFALNDTLSLNTAIAAAFDRAATFGAARLRQSTVTALQMGMTARVSRGVYLQPSVSYRLSGPGTGFTLGLNIPVSF